MKNPVYGWIAALLVAVASAAMYYERSDYYAKVGMTNEVMQLKLGVYEKEYTSTRVEMQAMELERQMIIASHVNLAQDNAEMVNAMEAMKDYILHQRVQLEACYGREVDPEGN